MVLTSFDPFRELDRAFARSGVQPRTLAMDAVRREHEVELRLDVPGFAPDEIDVTIEKNVLTVSAAHQESREQEGEQYLTRERRLTTARRQIVLSDVLDGSKVAANLEHGVLTLVIPVAEQAKPQKVSVGVGTAGRSAIEAEASEGGA